MKFDGSENKRSVWLKKGFFIILAAASIFLTGMFFLNHLYFAPLFALDPFLHSVFVVVLGLISADLGVLIWRQILQQVCESEEQRTIAWGMIGLTLLMAVLTTVGGIAEAFAGASLLPELMNTIIGWVVVIALATEFIFGAFLFDLFSPAASVQKAITDEIIKDADAMTKEIGLRMKTNREQRVDIMATEIASQTDGAILKRFMPNERQAKQSAPLPAPAALPQPVVSAMPRQFYVDALHEHLNRVASRGQQETTDGAYDYLLRIGADADRAHGVSAEIMDGNHPAQAVPAAQRSAPTAQFHSVSPLPFDPVAWFQSLSAEQQNEITNGRQGD